MVVGAPLNEEDGQHTLVGVVWVSAEASFLQRGSLVQDHISKDPIKFRGAAGPSTESKGFSHFTAWCPPVSVAVKQTRLVGEGQVIPPTALKARRASAALDMDLPLFKNEDGSWLTPRQLDSHCEQWLMFFFYGSWSKKSHLGFEPEADLVTALLPKVKAGGSG